MLITIRAHETIFSWWRSWRKSPTFFSYKSDEKKRKRKKPWPDIIYATVVKWLNGCKSKITSFGNTTGEKFTTAACIQGSIVLIWNSVLEFITDSRQSEMQRLWCLRVSCCMRYPSIYCDTFISRLSHSQSHFNVWICFQKVTHIPRNILLV